MKDETRAWFASSERDSRAGDLLTDGDFVEQGVFYLHLSVEKAIKAVICEQAGVGAIPRVHHLLILMEHTNLIASQQTRAFLARLIPHAVAARYASTDPGSTVEYSLAFYRELRKEALEVLPWIRQLVE